MQTRMFASFRLNSVIHIISVAVFAFILSAPTDKISALGLRDSIQFHGFASQAFIDTSHNNFFGKSSDRYGTFKFREIGINSSFRPLTDLLLSVQVLSRVAGKGDDGDLRLDYGLIDYSFIASNRGRAGIRAGVVKNPFGLYNETRDVAFLRPSILLPQSIYFDRVRNVALSSKGANLYGEYRQKSSELFLQFAAGYPNVGDKDTEMSLLGSNFKGSLEGDVSFIEQLIYEKDGGTIRTAVTAGQVNVVYNPSNNGLQPVREIHFKPWIFSFQYNEEQWSFTSEYALRSFNTKIIGTSDQTLDGESYYFQGTYVILNNWVLLLRYDSLFQDKNDRDGNKFAASTGRPNHSRFARDWTTGLRWNITHNSMISAEYHKINGTAWLTSQDNTILSETIQHWELFALMLSWKF